MKKTILFATSLLLLLSIAPMTKAQEWDAGLDIYSSYLWRGAKFGTGAAFQPWVEFSAGDFAIGGWGSVNTGGDEALEMDLYAGYSFGPVSIAVTDYYFGGDWTEFSMNHWIEPSISGEFGSFSALAAFMLLPETEETSFGEEMDMYFEAAYSFESFNITLGAGDGAYTDDGEFNICNIAIGTSKEIPLTEEFSLPLSGTIMLNPSTGGFHIAVGISL
jgi:hypothetical protein